MRPTTIRLPRDQPRQLEQPRAAPRRRATASTGTATTRRTCPRWSASTCRGSATSPGSTSSTCSATSAPTRCRSPGSGARSVTGLDFSQPALDAAAQLGGATRRRRSAACAVGRVRRARRRSSPASFDLVYTGIGALCWLPDVRRWAEVVAALLRPGGRLFIREGHPMLWSLVRPAAGRAASSIEFPYFEVEGGTRVRRGRRPTSSTRATARVADDGRLQPRPRRDLQRAAGRRAADHGVRGAPDACRGTRSATRWSRSGRARRVPAARHARSGSPRRTRCKPSRPVT